MGEFENSGSDIIVHPGNGDFKIYVRENLSDVQQIPFNLKFIRDNQTLQNFDFFLPLLDIDVSFPFGPDNYGYYCYENIDLHWQGSPENIWYDISTENLGNLPLSDDETITIDLPFAFRFYGNSYDKLSVCSNGWLAVGEVWQRDFRNWGLPNTLGPPGIISVFWDDLKPFVDGYENAVISWEFKPEDHCLVIEWDGVYNRFNQDRHSFQAIIYEAAYPATITNDNVIAFSFNEISDPDFDNNFSSTGIASPDRHSGLQYSYARENSPACAGLENGRVLIFSTNPPQFRPEFVIPVQTPQIISPANGTTVASYPFSLNWNNHGNKSFIEICNSDDFTSGEILYYRIFDETTNSFEITADLPLPKGTLWWRCTLFGNTVSISGTANSFTSDLPQLPGKFSLITPAQNQFINSTTPHLQWQISSESYNYSLKVATDIDFSDVIIDEYNLTENSFIPSAELSETTYYWKVTAENPAGTTTSETGKFRIDVTLPQLDIYLLPNPVFASRVEVYFITDEGLREIKDTITVNNELIDSRFTQQYLELIQTAHVFTGDDGLLSVQVTGEDSAGNVASIEKTYSYNSPGKQILQSPCQQLTISANGTSFLSEVISGTEGWCFEFYTTTGHSAEIISTPFSDGRHIEYFDGNWFPVSDNKLLKNGKYRLLKNSDIPLNFVLHQNYPNPFNPVTTISFGLAGAATVKLDIYDIRGRLVRNLFSGTKEAGHHELMWNAGNNQNQKVAAGIYFISMSWETSTANGKAFRKMLLVK